MKKGRHRRFEEARALKRSHDVDLDDLFDSLNGDDQDTHKPEHDAWADVAAEWEARSSDEDDDDPAEKTDADAEDSTEDPVG